jgi:hypothetical protein
MYQEYVNASGEFSENIISACTQVFGPFGSAGVEAHALFSQSKFCQITSQPIAGLLITCRSQSETSLQR